MTDLLVSPLEREARRLWAERELSFPAFTRQKWEQGTPLARATALAQVAARGSKPVRVETGTGSIEDESRAEGLAQTPPSESPL